MVILVLKVVMVLVVMMLVLVVVVAFVCVVCVSFFCGFGLVVCLVGWLVLCPVSLVSRARACLPGPSAARHT